MKSTYFTHYQATSKRHPVTGNGTYSHQAIDTVLYYTADVLSATDYYPFGSPMPGRNLEGDGYRFGFNSKEKDNEIYGNGNSYTAEYWQYDARLGRRWNVDPVDKPWMSSYHAFSNKPITNVDPNGALDDVYITGEAAEKATEQLKKSTNLKLNREESGKISIVGGSIENEDDQQLFDAITNPDIKVNVETTYETHHEGQRLFGGAFWGNTIATNDTEENENSLKNETASAEQVVNPFQCAAIDYFFGYPGQTILHEVTEAYQGALISIQKGMPAKPAFPNIENYIFEAAHRAATLPPNVPPIHYNPKLFDIYRIVDDSMLKYMSIKLR